LDLKSHSEHKWESSGNSVPVIPSNYNYERAKRAPVVRFGYFAYSKDSGADSFGGPIVGEASVSRPLIYSHWTAMKDNISTPFIAFHSANENWGLLSTLIPNRTLNWGSCCNEQRDSPLQEMLDHDKTLLFLVNQHYNFTHPKLLSLPRGIPIQGEHTKRFLWDAMRLLASHASKKNLVFTSSSNWGPRPQILNCIRSKFPDDGQFHGSNYGLENGSNVKERFTQDVYYERLGSARLSVALPGLGYDTFRLWEAMTLGTIPVIERGVGLDKTLWRLPALIVEDYDDVTPDLLRTAYVEALYRVDEFEFERLTQSWWWSFIANVSSTMSVNAVLEKFPLESEDSNFARPLVPFDCWKTNSCGTGTKKVPKSSC